MMNEKNNIQKATLESVQSAKEKLEWLKKGIDLDDPARLEAQLDALATDLLRSGLSEPMPGAPSLKEVLVNMTSRRQVPQEAIEAAENLAYLLEKEWYEDPDAPVEEQREAKRLAAVLHDKLIPILDAYAGS